MVCLDVWSFLQYSSPSVFHIECHNRENLYLFWIYLFAQINYFLFDFFQIVINIKIIFKKRILNIDLRTLENKPQFQQTNT